MINHNKYFYPILKNIPFTVSYDEVWFNRRIRHYLTQRMMGKDVGGVFMPTELKNGKNKTLAILANKWQTQFPKANIHWIDADNAKEYYWLKEHLQKDTWTDIDLLITSPVYASGIDIQNKFDLTAGFFTNQIRLHDYRALFNFETRERQRKEIITLFKPHTTRQYWDKYQKIFSDTKSEFDQIQQILFYFFGHTEDKLPITADDLFWFEETGIGHREWEYNEFIERILELAKHELKSKAFTTQELPRLAEYYGANVKIIHNQEQQNKHPFILDEKPYEFNGEEEPTELRDLITDISRTLKYVPKTISDLRKYKILINPPRQTIQKLINEIKELLGDEMIITNPQFVLSDTFKKLQRNKHRYDALLGWTMELNLEYNSPIKCLIQILNANGIDAKLQRGNSTLKAKLLTGLINNHREKDPKTGEKDPKGKRIIGLPNTPEHLTDCNNWKRDYGAAFLAKHAELIHPVFNGSIKSITYPLYLWNGLNEGLFDFCSLGEITQKYIRAHVHLIIEGGTI